MPCHVIPGVGIVCTSAGAVGRFVLRCPSCRKRRRVVETDHGWYGPAWACCACGYGWGEGAGDSNFKRERAKRQAWARATWPKALPRAEFNREVQRRMFPEEGL